MSIRSCLIALCVASAAAWVIAQEALPSGGPGGAPGADPLAAAATGPEHYSYAIGLQVGTSFHNEQLEIDVDSFLAGLKDGIAGAEPKYAKELLAAAVQRMYQQQEEKLRQRAEVARKQGDEFLVKNAKAPGIVVRPSGLQYKVLATGKGPSPKATDSVRAKYRGTFIDGKVFDESPAEGVPFSLDNVIDGWKEALQLMKVGDKWQLFVPGKLAYPEGRDEIPPMTMLIFEVELLGIEPANPTLPRLNPGR